LQPGEGRDYFVRFWTLIANEVKDHPSAFAAELMNEPMTIRRKWMFDTWRACAEAKSCSKTTDKKACKAKTECEWDNGLCKAAVKPEPEDCEQQLQFPGAQVKSKKKIGKSSKSKSPCECAEACAKEEKALAWGFKEGKKQGKSGKCQCYGSLDKAKCAKGNFSGYFAWRLAEEDEKKFNKKIKKVASVGKDGAITAKCEKK